MSFSPYETDFFPPIIDNVIAMQETPDMPVHRRIAAVMAADYCRMVETEHATRTVALVGSCQDQRRAALDLACRITGTTATASGQPQPDVHEFEVQGQDHAVFIAAELFRLFQTQLNWSMNALGLQEADFMEAMAAAWLEITAEELAGIEA
jgi:hypothetical protein